MPDLDCYSRCCFCFNRNPVRRVGLRSKNSPAERHATTAPQGGRHAEEREIQENEREAESAGRFSKETARCESSFAFSSSSISSFLCRSLLHPLYFFFLLLFFFIFLFWFYFFLFLLLLFFFCFCCCLFFFFCLFYVFLLFFSFFIFFFFFILFFFFFFFMIIISRSSRSGKQIKTGEGLLPAVEGHSLE